MPSASYSRVAADDESSDDERQPFSAQASGASGSALLLGTLQPAFMNTAAAGVDGTGLASRLLFSWARPVIDAVPADSTAAADLDATVADLAMGLHPSLASARQAALLGEHRRRAQFDEEHCADGTNKVAENRLVSALHGSVRWTFWLSGVFRLLAEVANLSCPVLLQWLVESLAAEVDIAEPLAAALLLAVAQVVNVMLLQQFIYGVFLSGGQATTSLTVVIFEKALRLPSDPSGVGKLTNLLAKDAASLRNFIVFAHNFWAAPLSVLASTVLLLRCLGWPALVGIALIPALIPLEKRLAGATKKVRKKTLAAADERMVAVHGAVECIEAFKLDPEGWEARVEGRISATRAKELSALLGEVELTVKNQVMMRVGPLAVAAVAFGVNALAGRELTPATAFSALALFSGIGHPFHVLPKCISLLASARASIERLAAFLELESVSNPPFLEYDVHHFGSTLA